MTDIQSVPLTPEQIESMATKGQAFLALTAEQLELIRKARPDQVCMLYGDALIRFPKTRMEPMLEVAFKAAARSAIELLKISDKDVATIQCDDLEFGQTFIRVTVTSGTGQSASAIGMLPDPRAH